MRKTSFLFVLISLLLLNNNALAEFKIEIPKEYEEVNAKLQEGEKDRLNKIVESYSLIVSNLEDEYNTVSKEYDKLLEDEISKIKTDTSKDTVAMDKEIKEKTDFLKNGKEQELRAIISDIEVSKSNMKKDIEAFLKKQASYNNS